MLVTQQPVLKRFWYPVMPMDQLSSDRPQPFQLLGQALALWLDADGHPAAVADQCCHRSAQLSNGIIRNGCVRCPYHGWAYDRDGTCVDVPQFEPSQRIPASYQVPSYKCAERYGYGWVCLDPEPLLPIPYIAEAEDAAHRLIPQFYEPWQCSGLRLMENSFDNAHFSFVHAESFGNQQQPEPVTAELSPLEYGLQFRATIPVVNPPSQRKNLNLDDEMTLRHVVSTWYMPFSRTLKITYPNGLMHLIFTAATPVSDRTSQIVQFCIRNDTEADAKAADIIAFDRQVTGEDKAVLETTNWDTPLDVSAEQHMPSDQPGIIMRRKLTALLKAHGEVEQRLQLEGR
ncbi:MAG: aromatic ring-hydroxylating dioxygenase subunit alpha [Kaiparowitsia implicata GSE-PSE-MK54-09C]|jgi:phenylpropionate dioxygenase-like ring-hydroxylating dioxygenase large terminal subunit|nr:aromatic ring-hydroxylating dioxygenase subunit alpha [Kaiparowitsia implicata GSE-PSE-MK54-09C]